MKKHKPFVGALPSIKKPTLIGGKIPIPFDYFIRFWCTCGMVCEFKSGTLSVCNKCEKGWRLIFKPEIKALKSNPVRDSEVK